MNCPKFKILIILFLVLFLNNEIVWAYDVPQSYDANILNVNFNSFVKPTKIVMVPLHISLNSNENISKTLFFYFADKLGFPQSPIQYMIDQNGKLSRLINIDEDFTGIITIGMDDRLTSINNDSIDVIGTIADKYDIQKSSIEVSNIKLKDDKKGINFIKGNNLDKYSSIINKIKSTASNKKLFNINNIEVPKLRDSTPSQIKKIDIKFKNTSGFNIYKDDLAKFYVSTVDNKDSDFFINNDWYSKSKTGALVESRIRNSDVGTMTFNIFTPLLKGKHSEDFIFVDQTGNKISQKFTVSLITTDHGQNVLQILENHGFGFVYVRSSPSAFGTIIGNINTSTKVTYTDLKNGFYKVQLLNPNLEGWIPAEFVQIL